MKRLLTKRAGGSKTLSIAPTWAEDAVADLAVYPNSGGTQATLAWTEALPGDYDNDGVVDIADLAPLAEYYGQRTDTGADDAHKLVNGDSDPEINIADLQAVANNYLARLEGYQVWRGHWNGTSTDWETSLRPNTNAANPNWSADRPSLPPVSARPRYVYADDISSLADKANVRYKVIPYGDGVPGAESGEVAMPAPGAGLADAPWPKFGGNNQNTFLSPYVGPQTNKVRWSSGSYSEITSNATLDAYGAVYFENIGGNLYSLNASDGSLRWSFAGSVAHSSPAIGQDGTLYVGSYDDNIYALSGIDGTLKWKYMTGGSVYSSPAIGADGTVYAGSYDMSAYALNPIDGSVKWKHTTGGAVIGSPAVAADGTIYIGSYDGSLYALNPSDGSVKWTFATGNRLPSAPAVGSDGTVYVGNDNSVVFALSPASGSLRWKTTAKAGSTLAIGPDGTIYASGWGSGDNLYALSASNGAVKWAYAMDNLSKSAAVGADGTVYVSGGDGYLHALSPDGSLKWKYACTPSTPPSIGADGTLYLGAEGRLIAFGVGANDRSVSGIVSAAGAPLPDVTLTLSPGGMVATTQAGGTYMITGVPPGEYTLTPFKVAYNFTPSSTGVTVAGSDVTGQDFSATVATAAVSGRVTVSGTPLPGVHVLLSPGGQTGITQSDGSYSIPNVANGSCHLTAVDAAFAFTPTDRTITVSGAGVTGQDFAASVSGLAQSAWPKYGGNARNTGQSPYVGAQTNTVKWTFPTGYPYPSPSMGLDGSVYIGSDDGYFYALNASDGSVKWRVQTGGGMSCGAVGGDGTVYIGGADGNLRALSAFDGAARWQTILAANGLSSSPAIGPDGTIYVGRSVQLGGNDTFFALSPGDGSVKWKRALGQGVYCPAIGSDGTVYVGADAVYALNPVDGTTKWSYPAGKWVGTPAVGPDGTIYAGSGDNNVYALNPGGTLKWQYDAGNIVSCSPAIGADGTIYFGTYDSKIYALNSSNGTVEWTCPTVGWVEGSPAIGADGTVYVSATRFYAISHDGIENWSFHSWNQAESSPAIGADGTVYFEGGSYLVAIGQ